MTNEQHESLRDSVARAEWIRWRMGDVPTIYANLLPPSSNAAILILAEQRIRRMVEDDSRVWQNDPWRHVGPEPKAVDWSEVPAIETVTEHLRATPMVGMPDVPREGFEQHPSVITAEQMSLKTAHYQAKRASEAARKERDAANSVYVAAVNSGDSEAIAAASDVFEKAAAKSDAAEAEFVRLGRDRVAGMAIVS